jgi:hypothetical protein
MEHRSEVTHNLVEQGNGKKDAGTQRELNRMRYGTRGNTRITREMEAQRLNEI